MKNRARKFLFVAGVLSLVSACSSTPYRYVPAQNRATNTDSVNEAFYSLPEENPAGSLRVQYLGVGDYQPAPDQPKVKSLHLRVVASNSATAGEWQVDSRSFFVSFPDGSRMQPATASPSSLKVPPRTLLGMDLYFPLPQDLSSIDKIPEFDLHWQVQALGQNFSETTAFDRVHLPEPPSPSMNARYYPSSSASTDDLSQDGWWG